MSLVNIRRGTVFHKENRSFTLQRKIDNSWQIEDIYSGEITKISEIDFLNDYKNQSITFNDMDSHIPKVKNEDSLVLASFDRLDESTKKAILHKKSLLENHIEKYGKSLQLKEIEKSIISFWSEDYGKKPHPTTVLKWLKKYFKFDKDIMSLLPSMHQKGNRNRRVNQEVESLCMQAIQEVYLTRECASKKSTLERVIYLIEIENNKRPKANHLEYPSINYIRKLIDLIPAYDVCYARLGQEQARKNFRNVLGHIQSDYPMHVVEIDHTQMDVIIADEFTTQAIGRPWLTMLIDTFTRCILGFHISLDPPSGTSLKNAIIYSILPKSNQEYPNTKSVYPIFGVFDILSADNGQEFHGKVLESMCHELGITVKYSARKTPWWKPHIEQMIGEVNRNVTERIPGKTFKNIDEKGDYNPIKKACVTLETLKAVTHKWIVDIYHQQMHRSLGMSPIDCWYKYVDPTKLRLPASISRLEISSGKVATRKLHHYGIEINSMLYNDKSLGEVRKIYGPDLNLEIRWNPDNLGSIYVIAPDGVSIKVSAMDSYKPYADGLTLFQHQRVKRQIAEDNKQINPENLALAKQEIYEMIEHDQALKKVKTRVKQQRFKNQTTRPQQKAESIKSPVSDVHKTFENHSDFEIAPPSFGSRISKKLAKTNQGANND